MRTTVTIAMGLAMSTTPAAPVVVQEINIMHLPKLAEKNVIIALGQEKLDVANVVEMAISYANIVVGTAHHGVQCVVVLV